MARPAKSSARLIRKPDASGSIDFDITMLDATS
jgi:hypothetical protein